MPIALIAPATLPSQQNHLAAVRVWAWELMIHESDLDSFDREVIPLVMVWNGEDHFSLTYCLMHHELNFWKAQNFFNLMESALDHVCTTDDKFFTEDVNEKVLAIMDEMDILVDQYKKLEQYATPEALTGL